MKTDEYFMKKAEELFQVAEKEHTETLKDIFKHSIYLALKEVARDQRYACAESIQQHPFDEITTSFAMQKIQNADIERDI